MARPRQADETPRARARPLGVAETRAFYGPAYILDASVAVKWFRPEEKDASRAERLRVDLLGERVSLTAPEWILLEAGNALARRQDASATWVVSCLETLGQSGVQFVPFQSRLIVEACGLSKRHEITLYDAFYLALAEDLQLPLITADEEFVDSVGRNSLIKPLAAFPEIH
mgnify:CR=1 FL=1